MAKPMPAIFFGHGNPMNALAHNAWTDGWAAIGKTFRGPRAVLSRLRPLVSSGHSGDRNACAAHDS